MNDTLTTKPSGSRSRVHSRAGRAWLLVIWALLIVAGFSALAVYDLTPGRAAPGPATSAPERTEAAGYTLVMAAHPRCPCTRASMRELAVLMTRLHGRMTATVWFYTPAGETADWARTSLWTAAEALPGVTARADYEGREAAALGAKTSGQVLLFDPAGRQVFAGGITGGRGHEGDNAGLRAVEAHVLGDASAAATTPVYGCSIMEETPVASLFATGNTEEGLLR